MLLGMMRKHAKSWIIKFLIGIIALVFIFYFGYSFRGDKRAKVAVVDGEIISGLEYQKAYRDLLINLQNEYKSVWSDNLIEVFDLKNRALEGLIDEKVLSQEARRIGLDVTEKEVQEEILAFPAFQFNGRFNEGRYRSLLANNRMKPEDFEETIAKDLLQRKLQQFLITFLPVTDQETLDYYTFSNQQIKVNYINFSPEDYKGSITPDRIAMEAYFEEHKEEYRIPEKIKISYITVDPAEFREQVTLSEQDILGYYEDNIEIYQEEKQVHARHILFNLESDAPEDKENKVREHALSVLEMAREGQDFAELAKKHSEGPTNEKGGDLGFFGRGRMVKAFEDAAFNMEIGQISDLVRTPFGFHIIKIEEIKEAKTKSLDEVREQIAESLISNDSMDLANEKALTLIDQMPYDIELAQYAEEHGVTAAHTEYFSQNEPIPAIEGDQKLSQSIFSLEKMDVSELIEFNNKFYLIQVTDKKESYLPELEEVSVQLNEDFTGYLAELEALAAGEKYLGQLKEGRDWDDLAKENNLEPETSDFFSRQGTIQEIGYALDLQEAAFSLNEDKVYPEKVFQNENGAFVIRWAETKGIDINKYEEEKEQYRNSIMTTKYQAVFSDWLENLKSKADIDRSAFEQYR